MILGDPVRVRKVVIPAHDLVTRPVVDLARGFFDRIEDDVFIGSDSQLIAPVKIGQGAYVGAGSTVTKDVPSKALAMSRMEQVNIEGWATKRQLKVKGIRRKAQSAKRKD